jgi:hypothetical protein
LDRPPTYHLRHDVQLINGIENSTARSVSSQTPIRWWDYHCRRCSALDNQQHHSADARVVRTSANMHAATGNSTGPGNGDQNNPALTAIVASLQMEKVVDSRIVQISLGGLSIVMAVVIIYRIWKDSWRALKLEAREE